MRITTKGQVTIPIEIREEIGLLPDTEVEFEVVDGAVLLRPAPGGRRERARRIVDRLRSARVIEGITTDEIMRLTRGDDWQSASPS